MLIIIIKLILQKNNIKVLNVSGNNLDSLSELGSLVNLEQLLASNNNLADMKEMSFLFKCWPRLWKLELNGNLLCLKNKYRERIIILAPNLESLDGKEIQEMSRQFLQNWKNSKEVSRGKQDPVSQSESIASQPGNIS
jgi:protein phosphatase 1 regulatory subunit 42